jgi:hypothetical protein
MAIHIEKSNSGSDLPFCHFAGGVNKGRMESGTALVCSALNGSGELHARATGATVALRKRLRA